MRLGFTTIILISTKRYTKIQNSKWNKANPIQVRIPQKAEAHYLMRESVPLINLHLPESCIASSILLFVSWTDQTKIDWYVQLL